MDEIKSGATDKRMADPVVRQTFIMDNGRQLECDRANCPEMATHIVILTYPYHGIRAFLCCKHVEECKATNSWRLPNPEISGQRAAKVNHE